VGFEILPITLKSALGRNFVASEIVQKLLMGIGPMIGIHGKLPFHFGEAFLRAL
jgi:hypothetical protein